MSPLELPQLKSSLLCVATLHKPRHWLQRQASVTNLVLMLGFAGMLVPYAIAPSAVHAYTGTVNVTIDVQPSETYDTLVRRAEAIARAATQRSFDRDILVTDVSIMIIAQSVSATVPVLSLTTTRTQWRSQPDPRRWATYYSTSKALLGMNKAPYATTAQPTVTTTAPAASRSAPATTTPTTPTTAPGGATTGSPQTSPTVKPSPILPQRIPTPGNIGK